LCIEAGICTGTGTINILVGIRRRDEKQQNLISSLSNLLTLKLEQYALLLYSR
jgi:hypothetical protein